MVLGEHIRDINEFVYFVQVPPEYYHKAWLIMQYIDGKFKEGDHLILYRQYYPDDGQWHSSSQTIPMFVAFRNEEDAIAFKLGFL